MSFSSGVWVSLTEMSDLHTLHTFYVANSNRWLELELLSRQALLFKVYSHVRENKHKTSQKAG